MVFTRTAVLFALLAGAAAQGQPVAQPQAAPRQPPLQQAQAAQPQAAQAQAAAPQPNAALAQSAANAATKVLAAVPKPSEDVLAAIGQSFADQVTKSANNFNYTQVPWNKIAHKVNKGADDAAKRLYRKIEDKVPHIDEKKASAFIQAPVVALNETVTNTKALTKDTFTWEPPTGLNATVNSAGFKQFVNRTIINPVWKTPQFQAALADSPVQLTWTSTGELAAEAKAAKAAGGQGTSFAAGANGAKVPASAASSNGALAVPQPGQTIYLDETVSALRARAAKGQAPTQEEINAAVATLTPAFQAAAAAATPALQQEAAALQKQLEAGGSAAAAKLPGGTAPGIAAARAASPLAKQVFAQTVGKSADGKNQLASAVAPAAAEVDKALDALVAAASPAGAPLAPSDTSAQDAIASLATQAASQVASPEAVKAATTIFTSAANAAQSSNGDAEKIRAAVDSAAKEAGIESKINAALNDPTVVPKIEAALSRANETVKADFDRFMAALPDPGAKAAGELPSFLKLRDAKNAQVDANEAIADAKDPVAKAAAVAAGKAAAAAVAAGGEQPDAAPVPEGVDPAVLASAKAKIMAYAAAQEAKAAGTDPAAAAAAAVVPAPAAAATPELDQKQQQELVAAANAAGAAAEKAAASDSATADADAAEAMVEAAQDEAAAAVQKAAEAEAAAKKA